MSCGAALLDFDPEPLHPLHVPVSLSQIQGGGLGPMSPAMALSRMIRSFPRQNVPTSSARLQFDMPRAHNHSRRLSQARHSDHRCCFVPSDKASHLQPCSHVKMGDITLQPTCSQYKSTGLPCPVHLSLSVSTTKALTTILQFFFRH